MPLIRTEEVHSRRTQDHPRIIRVESCGSHELPLRMRLSNSQNTVALEPPSDVQEKLLTWYLEDHPLSDPLERVKSSSAEAYLRSYGSRLLQQLPSLHQPEATTAYSILVDDACDDCPEWSINEIHWETLEEQVQDDGESPTVMRVVEAEVAVKDRSIHLHSSDPFRVLLICARNDLSESGQYIAMNALTQCVDVLGSDILQVDIVRPGTFSAFKRHLAQASKRGVQYNLVHFDLHGMVKCQDRRGCQASLLFYPEAENDPKNGCIRASTVANVVSNYCIPYVVLNACESASQKVGAEANLARVFVRKGIPFVLGMSYKLMASAINIFAVSFYNAMLLEGKSFPAAATCARGAMRLDRLRTAKLGLLLQLDDWIVPVTYVSREMTDPRKMCHYRHFHQHRGRSILDYTQASAPWDTDLLNLETRLLDPWDCGVGPIVNLYGFAGLGKTTLLEYSLRWWTKTSMVQKAVYFSFRQSGYIEPSTVLLEFARALTTREPNPIHIVNSIECRPDLDYEGALDAVYEWLAVHDADRRFLLVLDDFPTYTSSTDYSPLTREQQGAWRKFLYEDFARFRKQAFVIIASCAKLHWLSLDTVDPYDATDSSHLKGDDTPTSPFYCLRGRKDFLVEANGTDAPIWMSLGSPESFQLIIKYAEYLGFMPSLLDYFIAQPMKTMSGSAQEMYGTIKAAFECFLRGKGILNSPETVESDSISSPVMQLCESYYQRQGPVEKAILLSLSKFVTHLGDDLGAYWSDYIRCLQTDTARCMPRNHHSSRILPWKSKPHKLPKARHWIFALQKENVDGVGIHLKGNKVLKELCRIGLLKPTFLFLRLNEGRHLTKDPVYRIHPCLSIYLQEKAMDDIPRPDNYSSNDTWTFAARTKFAFLTYLRRRIESWDGSSSSFAVETDSPAFFQGLNSQIEEGILRQSVLAGVHMWLEQDTDHRDISFPKAVFDHYLAPWPSMTRDIESSEIADLVERTRPFFESNFQHEYLDARALQQHALSRAEAKRKSRWDYGTMDAKISQELAQAHTGLITSLISLREELQLGTWLVWHYVLRGRPQAALRQVEQNRGMLESLPEPKFSEIAAFVPGLRDEIQHARLVAGFLTTRVETPLLKLGGNRVVLENMVQRLSNSTMLTDDPISHKFCVLGPQLLQEALRSRTSHLTWTIRTREESEDVSRSNTTLLRKVFEQLMAIPFDWYKAQWTMLPRLISMLCAKLGLDVGDFSITPGAIIEFFAGLPKDIRKPLKKLSKLIRSINEDLTDGYPVDSVFDTYYTEVSTLIATVWRSATLFFLDYTTHTNNLIEAVAYHHFIIVDYFHRRDWEALALHLSHLSNNELEQDPQWSFIRGACALHLGDWETAGTELEAAFEATQHITQYQLTNFFIFGALDIVTVRCLVLRHLLAYKYAVPTSRDACTLPAWSLYLRYWIYGYATRAGAIYAQNGALLEQFTEHYFAPLLEPRRVDRALDPVEEWEYGHAILCYGSDQDEARMGRSKQKVEAHVLIEFIQHALLEGFLFKDDVEGTVMAAETFMRSWEPERRDLGASKDFFKRLAEACVAVGRDKKTVFEEFEKELLGQDNAEYCGFSPLVQHLN